jgi:hypothetical protein
MRVRKPVSQLSLFATAFVSGLLLLHCSCSMFGTPGSTAAPNVKYADCEVWGQKGFEHLECFVLQVAGISKHRLQFVRDDGLVVVPEEMTLDNIKEQFVDSNITDRGGGRLSVTAGGLTWYFLKDQAQPQSVRALWRTDWRVLNTENNRELSLPCTLHDVLHVLGRECVASDSRGEIELPNDR